MLSCHQKVNWKSSNVDTCSGDNCLKGNCPCLWRDFLSLCVVSTGNVEKSYQWDTDGNTGVLVLPYFIQNEKGLGFKYNLKTLLQAHMSDRQA